MATAPDTGKLAIKVGLISLMAVGSIALWLGIPVAWIWLASQMADSSQPSLGPYLLVILGIPVSMAIVGRFLFRLNGVYGRLTGTTPAVRVRMAWLKSMRGERDSGRPRTVLDVVMVVSVAGALLVLGVWFFLFAGSSLPG